MSRVIGKTRTKLAAVLTKAFAETGMIVRFDPKNLHPALRSGFVGVGVISHANKSRTHPVLLRADQRRAQSKDPTP